MKRYRYGRSRLHCILEKMKLYGSKIYSGAHHQKKLLHSSSCAQQVLKASRPSLILLTVSDKA
jgi:hypothetical protein